MSKRFLNIALIAVSGLIFFNCAKQEKQDAEQPKEEVKEINELPYLSYLDLTAGKTTTRELPGNSILILFNTDCDHCQHEAAEINEKAALFKDYQLYFIAADSIHQIQKFAQTYGLAAKANMHFGRAEFNDVFMNFGSISTPAIYIYSRERRFVKSFFGQTPIEEIVKFL
jgi:peroxiredoxin